MAPAGYDEDVHVLLSKASGGVDAEDFEDTMRARRRGELTLCTIHHVVAPWNDLYIV